MLFSDRDSDHGSPTIRIVRDVVEILAIVAAGCWAFYVFIYENRIKPLLGDLQPSIVATLDKTSQRDGAVGIRLKTEVRNVGGVRFYFIGYAVTVLGSRMTLSSSPLPPSRTSASETTSTFFRLSKAQPVYGFGFLTTLADPSSTKGGELQPGSSTEQEHTFFIPGNRFDLLTVHVSACFGKSEKRYPAHFAYHIDGVAGLVCGDDAVHVAYDVGSLDLR